MEVNTTIHLFAFRLKRGIVCFYENIETGCGILEKTEIPFRLLSGQHVDYGKILRGMRKKIFVKRVRSSKSLDLLLTNRRILSPQPSAADF